MDKLQSLIIFLTTLVANRFYGETVIKWEAGNIVLVRNTETIKL